MADERVGGVGFLSAPTSATVAADSTPYLFIEELYRKRFGRVRPELVLSIEEHVRQQVKKRAEKREAKLRRREAAAAAEVDTTGSSIVEPGFGNAGEDDPSW